MIFRSLLRPQLVHPFLQTSNYTTRSLFVGNLNWKVDKSTLFDHFQTKVKVESAYLPLDASGRSKGYGFVEVDEKDVEVAVQGFNETEYLGRTIRVWPATNKKPEPRVQA